MNRKAWKGIGLVLRAAPLTFILDAVAVTLSLSLPFLTAVCWKYVLTTFDSSNSELLAAFTLLALVGGFSRAYPYLGELFDAYFRDKTSLQMQSRIHQKAIRLSGDQYEDPALNDLIMMSGDTFFYGTVAGVALAFIYVFASVVSLLLSLGLVIHYFSLHVALAFTGFILVHFAKVRLSEQRGKTLSKLEALKRDEQIIREYFSKPDPQKDRKLWNLDQVLRAEWCELIEGRHRTVKHITNKYFLLNLLSDVAASVLFVFVLFLVLSNLHRPEIGNVGAILLLSTSIKQQVQQVTSSLSGLAEVSSYIGKGVDFLELPETISSPNEDEEREFISLSDVSYRYPGSDNFALIDVSLTIQLGKSYAIVGANGSGKTTLFKLILGLISPSQGSASIRLPRNASDPSYSEVSIAPQDYNNYQLSVRECIEISDSSKKYDEDLAVSLAREFSVLDRIQGMKGGFDTHLGKEFGGEDLSGGQWQSLSLIRCFYKDSKCCILDEPTASLDAYKEAQTYDAILNRVSDKTSVVITHRMGLMKEIDHVFVLDSGRLVEQGSHSELMKMKGLYYQLYSSQLEQFQETSTIG